MLGVIEWNERDQSDPFLSKPQIEFLENTQKNEFISLKKYLKNIFFKQIRHDIVTTFIVSPNRSKYYDGSGWHFSIFE